MADKPEITPAPRGSRVTLLRDIIGTIQDAVAILAFLAAGMWFWMQHPFSPIIRANLTTSVQLVGSEFEVSTKAVFENAGHVPYKFKCTGIGIDSSADTHPKPQCLQDEMTLSPGEQWTVGALFQVSCNESHQTHFVLAEIGTAAPNPSLWDNRSYGSREQVLFEAATHPDGASPPGKATPGNAHAFQANHGSEIVYTGNICPVQAPEGTK